MMVYVDNYTDNALLQMSHIDFLSSLKLEQDTSISDETIEFLGVESIFRRLKSNTDCDCGHNNVNLV